MARPRLEFNLLDEKCLDQFKKLCVLHCTKVEVANFFDCSEDTVERRCDEAFGESFAVCLKRFSSEGKMSLRRHQFKAAEKGNVTMLIWLGKQWLEQSDKNETTHEAGKTWKLAYSTDGKGTP